MARKPSAILTAREYEVMDVVWKLEEGTVHDIRIKMGERKEYNSVATMVRYLEQKQLLTHRLDGRTFYYKATKSRLEVQQEALKYILETFFDNDINTLNEHIALFKSIYFNG